MSTTLKSIFPDALKKLIRKKIYGTENFGIHYSQCGEDITIFTIVNRFLKINTGFFVDVGSFHPHNGSNTFYYTKTVGKGLTLTPDPDLKNYLILSAPVILIWRLESVKKRVF